MPFGSAGRWPLLHAPHGETANTGAVPAEVPSPGAGDGDEPPARRLPPRARPCRRARGVLGVLCEFEVPAERRWLLQRFARWCPQPKLNTGISCGRARPAERSPPLPGGSRSGVAPFACSHPSSFCLLPSSARWTNPFLSHCKQIYCERRGKRCWRSRVTPGVGAVRSGAARCSTQSQHRRGDLLWHRAAISRPPLWFLSRAMQNPQRWAVAAPTAGGRGGDRRWPGSAGLPRPLRQRQHCTLRAKTGFSAGLDRSGLLAFSCTVILKYYFIIFHLVLR